jgi:hypothetical protein
LVESSPKEGGGCIHCWAEAAGIEPKKKLAAAFIDGLRLLESSPKRSWLLHSSTG